MFDGMSFGRGHRVRAATETCMTCFTRFLGDESGATVIEYGLITAGICLAIITVVNLLGSQLQTTFNIITSDLQSAGK
jgi:pilus assembly protein Flp/PilA